MTMQLLATNTLSTASATITFSGIPQTATDLIVYVSARVTATGSFSTSLLRWNSLTSSYYTMAFNAPSGSSVNGNSYTSEGVEFPAPNASSNSNWGNAQFYIPRYATTIAKSVGFEAQTYNSSNLDRILRLGQGYHANTSAITSITIAHLSSTFVAGTTVSLYTVTKA